MSVKTIIKVSFIFYTILVLFSVSATNLSFIDMLPGLLIMWTTYFFFVLGNKLFNPNKKRNRLKNQFLIHLFQSQI